MTKRHGVRRREGDPSPAQLRSLYVDQQRSTTQIADQFSIPISRTNDLLKHDGIPRRNRIEAATLRANANKVIRDAAKVVKSDLNPYTKAL